MPHFTNPDDSVWLSVRYTTERSLHPALEPDDVILNFSAEVFDSESQGAETFARCSVHVAPFDHDLDPPFDVLDAHSQVMLDCLQIQDLDLAPRIVRISGLVVGKDLRGRKIGSLLLSRILTDFYSEGACFVVQPAPLLSEEPWSLMGVSKDHSWTDDPAWKKAQSRLVRWYRRFGFEWDPSHGLAWVRPFDFCRWAASWPEITIPLSLNHRAKRKA